MAKVMVLHYYGRKVGSNVDIHKYSHSHIDVIILDLTKNLKWRATGFYGHPDT